MLITTHDTSPTTRHRLFGLVAAAGIALSVLQLPTGGSAATPPTVPATNGVTLRLVTSSAASAGDVVPVEVWADGVSEAAAFEVVGTIDPGAGRIVAAASDEALARDDLSIGDLSGFAVLAGYSAAGDPIATATARLGTFDVRLDAEGAVSVALGQAMVVDSVGREIPVGDVVPATIQVGGASGQRPATAMPWSLSPRGAGDDSLLSAAELEMEWQTARLDGAPCAGETADAAGGCIDIGDVQRVAVTPQTATTPRTTGPKELTVDSRGDQADRRVGDGICATKERECTLRAAIQEANVIAGPNVIRFAIPGSAPYRIETTRRLPAMNDTTGRTYVNGYTQPGSEPNTAKFKSNARILIEVVGDGADGHDGFAIRSGGNVLRGLSIYAFRRPVWIFRTGDDARGNRVIGSFIGTDPSGQYRERNQVDFAHGIHVEQGSPNTRIGGPRRADRNVISGNAYHGIGLWHAKSDNTLIRNNIIGLSPLGDRRLQNQEHGIDINYGVSGSTIGGKKRNQRNVISGNNFNGLEMSHRPTTTDNLVMGNLIGTRLSGRSATAWSANGGSGLWIEDGASNNRVVRNIFGANVDGGIRIINNGVNGVSSANIVQGNRIGISKKGRALPQGAVGVYVEGESNVISRNVIAHHARQGIVVAGPFARYNTFSRNRFFGNGRLAIDIAPLGTVNVNDAGDSDTGPNALLNFPEFTKVTRRSATGTACAGCRVEVFVTGAEGARAPGHGPAEKFLGATVADESGRFVLTFARLRTGTWLSSTATNTTGSTSEMSTNVQIIRK